MWDWDLHIIASYDYDLAKAKETRPNSPSSPSPPSTAPPSKYSDAFKGLAWAWEDWGVSLRQMLG
ncbi:hypothetical protein FS749_011583 [Ceratobasidium sp. UAMH 11750]|nr:hypothetical protein FS749_011583 [Ceratobasidium sp. UAMH 11750]